MFSTVVTRLKLFFIQNGLWLFWPLLVIAYQQGLIWQSLPLAPRALHISAQCDRACFAQNYYYDGIDLLHPRINNLSKGTGIAAAEFPLLAAVAAGLYHILGYHDIWYRLMVLLLFTWGCRHAYILAKQWLSTGAAAAVILLWMSSPVLMYYAPNFNPDPAALGFTLFCWLLFYSTNQYRTITIFIFFTLGASLAMLLKASTAISFVAMAGLIVADYLKWLSPHKRRVLAHKSVMLAAMVIAAIVSYLWYRYAARLNDSVYSNFFTLTSRTPESSEQFFTIAKNFSQSMLLRYYHPIILVLLLLAQMAVVLWNRYLPRILVLTTLALCAGTFIFMYLMFVAIENHDYYIIAMMPWPLFLLIAIAALLEYVTNKILRNAIKYCSIILIIGSLVYSSYANDMVYRNLNDPFYEAYYDLEPHLRKAGIHRNDCVVSMTDCSYDVSLYLINQKGYTVFDRHDVPRVWYYLNHLNGKYLITNSYDCLPESPLIQSYVGKPIITHKNISVYKPSKNLHVNSIVSERIQLFRTKFLNDEKMMTLQQNVSKATGISIDALIDDVCIYLYKVTDEELQPKFKTYCAQHNEKDTTLLIENFILENKLNEEQSYVIRHPYRLWFN